MTEKQKRFADEYLIDLNATRAYKVAYPSIKNDETARVNGSRMLTNANVKSYIGERIAEMQSEKTATAQEVLEYLTKGIRFELNEEVVVVIDGSPQIITRRISLRDSNKCAELLAKRHRLLIDKVEADINRTVVFEGENGLED